MSPRTAATLLAALACLPCGRRSAGAFEDISVPIQRILVNITLGNKLKHVKTLCPPSREWPTIMEPGGEISRVMIERSYARNFPDHVAALQLGVRYGKLVRIKAVFDAEQTHKEPLETMVVKLSTMYGEPRRQGYAYVWRDSRTVLRASNEELPTADGASVQLHASLEVMDADTYRP
ncbi:MAG: hypothetical protein HY078_07070 [Elusimicrobia bacterium]|nr:hypothetical protein [Elusimicrobiota bacterium]